MSSIEETLRKSRQIEEQYRKFMKDKEETDKQWKATEDRIDQTLTKLAKSKEDIKRVDEMYEKFQKSFSDMVDAAVASIEKNKLLEKAAEDFAPIVGDPKKVGELLRSKKKIMILTGAGLSSASGIPTFRDATGFWTKKKEENISPEIFLSLANFDENPLSVWQWIEDFYAIKSKCKPNLGHACLDALCTNVIDKGFDARIVTQNVDNFHIESRNPSPLFKSESQTSYPIYEIHGNILKVRCEHCS